jgi:hypothetical protein
VFDQRARRAAFAPQRPVASTSLVLALAVNLGVAAIGWLAIDVLTDGVDYNFGLWAVPVMCLLFVTAGLGVMALSNQLWRRSGIGILLAVPIAVMADLVWLLIYILEATKGG